MTTLSVIQARNRGIITGILGGAIGRSVSLLAPFIVMPAMLNQLGGHLFGVWMTALALTSMALFVDFGIGNGLLTRLSTAYGKHDYEVMRRYIASAYVALGTIALVLLMFLAAVQAIMSMGWLAIAIPDTKTVSVIVVSLVTFVLGIPASVIQRVMYANQKAWLSHMWQICGAALSVILTLLAINYALPAWQIIAAYSAPTVIILLVSTLVFFYNHEALRPHVGDISKESAVDLLKIGSRFLALSVVTSCALNVDNVLISYQLGAAAVTEYAVPAKLASLLGLVISTIFLPLWAANGEALARRDYAWVRRTTLKMSVIGGGVIALVSCLLILLSSLIIDIWMGRSFKDQNMIILFFSILSFCMAITSPFNMVLNSIGLVRPQIKIWLAFMALSFSLKFLLLKYGYAAFIIPAITAFSYMVTIMPFMIFTNLKIDFGSKIKKVF